MSTFRSFFCVLFTSSLLIAASGAILLIPVSRFPDFGFFVWTMLIIIVDLLVVRFVFRKIRITFFTLCCLTAYILLSFGFVISTKIHVLNILFCMFTLTVLNLNLISDLFEVHMLPRYLFAFFIYIFTKFEGNIHWIKELLHSFTIFKRRHNKLSKPFQESFQPIILFLLIGLPVIIIAVTLLSQANQYFSQWIKTLIFIDISFSTLFGRLFFFLIAFIYFITEFYFYFRIKQQQEFSPDKHVTLSQSFQLNWIKAGAITMVFLNLFYLLFVVAELQYDLGNLQGLLVKKGISSYSHLAVSRFWELIMVSGINLSIMYFLIYPFRQSKDRCSHLVKNSFLTASLILMLNTLLLVISSWLRLQLYISGYGFSLSRYMGLSFLPVLIVIIIFVLISFRAANCGKWYSYAFGLCILYFAAIVSLPNNYIINRLNLSLARADAIAVYDPLYTIPQRNRNDVTNNDGLPIALELLKDDTSLTPACRKKITAAVDAFQKSSETTSWREMNFMRMWIASLLNKHHISNTSQ